MSNDASIAQTEQRVTEINALQQTITDLQNELLVYREEVRKELASLRQQAGAAPAAPEPAPPEPTRPAVAERPAARPQPPKSPPPNPPPSKSPPPAPTRQVKVQPLANLPRGKNDDDFDEVAGAEAGGPAETSEKEEVSVGGRPVSVLISNGLADSEPQNGWVIDRPANGLRILVDEPMQPGTVLTLRPTKDHPQNQWVTVSVRGCRPERNSYVVNVHFIDRPPWAVMNLLNGS